MDGKITVTVGLALSTLQRRTEDSVVGMLERLRCAAFRIMKFKCIELSP